MGSDSSKLEAKEASSNLIHAVSQYVGKLMTMNSTTKTKLRQYNLAIIFGVDTIRSSAGRIYFDKVVHNQMCARDH